MDVHKRQRLGVISVFFGSEELQLPSGTKVQDAVQLIRKGNGAKDLIVEAHVGGSVCFLPPSFPLQHRPGWQYKARPRVLVTPITRRFATGHGIKDSSECYYVPPKNDESLLADLRAGKYRVICDRRQSGKTTTVYYIAEQLRQDGITTVYVGGLGSSSSGWSSQRMWRSLCFRIHTACPALFPEPPEANKCSEETFYMYFERLKLGCKVVLVIDEADSLLRLPTQCLDEFFHTVRDIKTQRDLYNLWAFLLVGVETVKDLLEASYDRRRGDAANEPSSTPSRLSPFPHDPGCESVPAFEIDDIVALLEQANREHNGRIRDIEEIATSVWQLTVGHKGLVGSCLAFLMQQEAFSYGAWLELSDSFRLGRHVFGQATYHRMMMYFKGQTRQQYDLLEAFLVTDELFYDVLTPLRDLLAEGVVVSREEGDGYAVKMSSPLLRTAILRRCSILGQKVYAPPCPRPVDREWVICEALTTLDVEMMRKNDFLSSFNDRPVGSSSEYAQQFMFMCRIKAVLQQAYPSAGAVVLPEVKEIPVPGSKRSMLRLDTLVRHRDQFPRFGFDYLVKGTKADVVSHYRKSVTYSRQHSAHVYLMHFAVDEDPVEIEPEDDSVYFWGVRFNCNDKTAKVRTLDCSGTKKEFVLRMKNWTGKFNFEDIV